ncbi:hypothetical protein [Rufibacter hautae]|uniref:DUF3592 domain-containing protein n=1 Tax=Rufibacter hautae TaxID=2595005 RepID=A0A5B6TD74_9BACT|nr:hypothetical protein [Rufibacter hautae]KAA3436901.1 hypothetical protein FOA19_21235 [Rufibacter hautae]
MRNFKRVRSTKRGKKTDWKARGTWASFIALLLGSYLRIFHSHYYDSVIPFIAFFLVFFSIAALHGMWLEVLPGSKWEKTANAFILLGLYIPTYLILTWTNSEYLESQLQKYGVVVEGRVESFYKSSGRRKAEFVVFHYKVGNQEYVQEVENDTNLGIGDIVSIRCSSEDPELFTLQLIN